MPARQRNDGQGTGSGARVSEASERDLESLAGDEAAVAPEKRRRAPWGLLLKGGVTAALAWLIADKVELSVVAERLGRIDAGWLVAAILLILLQYLAAALRWQLILRTLEHGLPPRRVAEIFAIGLFFNQALPSTIGGDALRIWRTYAYGLPLGHAVSGVLLDRALGFVALFVLAAVGLPWSFPLLGDGELRWFVPGLIACAFLGLAFLLTLDRLLPAAWHRRRMVRGLAGLAQDGRQVLLHLRSLVPLTAIGLLSALAAVAVVYCLAQALALPLSLLSCLMLVPILFTVTAVPVSLAGWGLREGAAIFLFGLVGLPQADALALSLAFGLLAAITSLPGGLVWLLTRERDRRAAPART